MNLAGSAHAAAGTSEVVLQVSGTLYPGIVFYIKNIILWV